MELSGRALLLLTTQSATTYQAVARSTPCAASDEGDSNGQESRLCFVVFRHFPQLNEVSHHH